MIEIYQPCPFLFADKQRKGTHEAFGACCDMPGHVERALKEKFPLAQDIPLPKVTQKSADFIADSCPRAISAFWDSQLDRVKAMVSDVAEHQRTWDSAIFPSTKTGHREGSHVDHTPIG